MERRKAAVFQTGKGRFPGPTDGEHKKRELSELFTWERLGSLDGYAPT